MSNDIKIDKGDLAVYRSQEGLDLLVEDSATFFVKRALLTPPEWLRIWIIDSIGLSKRDSQFGDALYKQLSDPLTYDWISIAYSNVKKALELIDEPDIKILNISLQSSSTNGEGMDTADIEVTYSYKDKIDSIRERVEI